MARRISLSGAIPILGGANFVDMLIDEHLTEDYLTPQWLAARLGLSLRTLQDDMAAQGAPSQVLSSTSD